MATQISPGEKKVYLFSYSQVLHPICNPPTVRAVPAMWAIQLYQPRRQAPYIVGHRAGLGPGCARRQAKTQWPRFNEIRQTYILLYMKFS